MDAKIKGLVVMYCAYYITSGLIFNKITFELFRRDPHIFHNAQLQLGKIFIRNIKYVKSPFSLLGIFIYDLMIILSTMQRRR